MCCVVSRELRVIESSESSGVEVELTGWNRDVSGDDQSMNYFCCTFFHSVTKSSNQSYKNHTVCSHVMKLYIDACDRV